MRQAALGDHENPGVLHHGCFACGYGKDGLALRFRQASEDTVTADWVCRPRYRSYPGIAHGGILATVLDSAMTNCLLARGVPAVTAEMRVQYLAPLRIGETAKVSASLVRSHPPLFILEARIIHDGSVIAMATGKFMQADVWSRE